MKFLPKFLAAAALAAAVLPATAQAAPPWSDPVAVPGSNGQAGGAPDVLFTRTRGGAIAFNAPGSIPGAPTLRSVPGDSGPLTASPWPGAKDFDSTFGAFAAGDRVMYVGPTGRHVTVGIAPGPQSTWTLTTRGPSTGGARVAATAAPHAGTAGAFATFERGGGYVYLVRQLGIHAPSATQRVSEKRASIRSVAVAMNSSGDVLVAWDQHGTIQSRFWYGSFKRFGPVQDLGKVDAAMHVAVALGNDRRAIVSWVDQRVSEGNTGQKATVWATARTAHAGFAKAKQLEAFPDTTIPGGSVVQSKFTADGRGIIAWSGRTAVRAAFVNGRTIGAAQDLAPTAPNESLNAIGLADLVVAPNGAAAVTIVSPVDATRNQVLVAPLAPHAAAFGPAETVSEPSSFLADTSAAFDPATNRLFVAWRVASQDGNRVELATRLSP